MTNQSFPLWLYIFYSTEKCKICKITFENHLTYNFPNYI